MSNKSKIREEVKKLNPIDDMMFRKMAEDKEFCQEILRVILEDDKLVVLESIPQWVGTNLQGRSVILDAKCVKGDGMQVVTNGFTEVYVNAKVKDGSEVSELMEVFTEDQTYNEKFPKTSEGKHRYKETEGGLEVMCEISEKIRMEGRKEGLKEGQLGTLIDLVRDNLITISEAAKRAEMTEANFAQLLKTK
jgi:hypothetical protein